MTWAPIALSELQTDIQSAERKMAASEAVLWRMVSFPPEKWALSPWGDDGGGFWVVGVTGKQCIYYNDIEGGFNVSSFTAWGTIGHYWCNQDELQWIVHRMIQSINGEPCASPNAGPPEPFGASGAAEGPASVS